MQQQAPIGNLIITTIGTALGLVNGSIYNQVPTFLCPPNWKGQLQVYFTSISTFHIGSSYCVKYTHNAPIAFLGTTPICMPKGGNTYFCSFNVIAQTRTPQFWPGCYSYNTDDLGLFTAAYIGYCIPNGSANQLPTNNQPIKLF